jgi:hypothetical protein
MAADPWIAYGTFRKYLGDGTINLDSHTFKCALFLSTSNAATVTNTVYGDLTNEVASGFGYTTGGEALTSTWTQAGSVVTFDSASLLWTATGGPITCRYAVIYDDTQTSPSKPLVAFCLLNNTPADVTVTDGNTLTISPNISGLFDLSGMDTP